MKTMKQFRALLLAALMAGVLLLSACGEPQSKEADYTVTVLDAAGNPVTEGYAVRFLQDGQQVAMQLPNAEGKAVKNLTRGEYTVQLQFTGDEGYTYDQSDLTLTADKTELTVKLSYTLSGETRTLGTPQGEAEAYFVKTGCTQIPLSPETMTYLLYVPTQPGSFEFSLIGSDAAIGYYGAPHFVQPAPAVEVVDNKFTLSIRSSMISPEAGGSNALVIGIAPAEGTAVLSIVRTGDPAWSVEDEPWQVYRPTVEVKPYTLSAGSKLKDFDLTSQSVNLVLNETDGCYHLDSADGPLVLVRLGKTTTPNRYLDCFETILEHSGVVAYFYDENGEFLKKEEYGECLKKYIENVDETSGTYPLTEDLKYIIQTRGDQSGWFDPDHSLYLFVDEAGNQIPGINPEISWLFMCCYIG